MQSLYSKAWPKWIHKLMWFLLMLVTSSYFSGSWPYTSSIMTAWTTNTLEYIECSNNHNQKSMTEAVSNWGLQTQLGFYTLDCPLHNSTQHKQSQGCACWMLSLNITYENTLSYKLLMLNGLKKGFSKELLGGQHSMYVIRWCIMMT